MHSLARYRLHYVGIARLASPRASLLPPWRNKTEFQRDTVGVARSLPWASSERLSGRRSYPRAVCQARRNITAIDPAKPLRRQFCIFFEALVHCRSFTPRRYLIGCAPWPTHYTGCQNTFSPLVILPVAIQDLPPYHLPSFIPALLKDKGYACLYLKAADRMKCTMELSPHVAFREVKDAFRGPGLAAPCKPPPQKRTLRQEYFPGV